jgi:hypothetical protein
MRTNTRKPKPRGKTKKAKTRKQSFQSLTPEEMQEISTNWTGSDQDFIDEIAGNMSIYAGLYTGEYKPSDEFVPQAKQVLASFKAIEGRSPNDYLEIETWSREHLSKGGWFLVIPIRPGTLGQANAKA